MAKIELTPYQEDLKQRLENQHGVIVNWRTGSGKCLHGDTKIFTTKGLIPIKEFFTHLNNNKATEIFEKPFSPITVFSLCNSKIIPTKVRNIYRQKINENLISLETNRGIILKVTKAHPLLINDGGYLVWKRAGDLKKGDFLSCASLLNIEVPSPLSDNLLKLLAWQITEGHEADGPKGKISAVITQKDPSILKELEILCNAEGYHTKLTYRIRKKQNNIYTLYVSSQEWRNTLEKYGYTWGKNSNEKKFPNWITTIPKESAKIVLKALFDAEGHFGKNSIEFSSASSELVQQVQGLLLKFGISSGVHSSLKMATNGARIKRRYYRLTISGEGTSLYLKHIESDLAYKQRALVKLANKQRNPNTGVPIYNLGNSLVTAGFSIKIENFGTLRHKTIGIISLQRLIHKVRSYASKEKITLLNEKIKTNIKNATTGGNFKIVELVNKIKNKRKEFKKLLKDLSVLEQQPLRYEIITNISQEKQRYVYDIEVDSDEYSNKNFLATSSAVVCHNTIGSVAAIDPHGDTRVIVPAALRENYKKELKAFKPRNKFEVESYEKFLKHPEEVVGKPVVFDEAHALRTSGSTRSQAAQQYASKASKVLLLTGTPIQNAPHEIAPLVNIAAGGHVLPTSEKEFNQRYVQHLVDNPGILRRLFGAKQKDEYHAKNLADFVARVKPYYSSYKGETDPSIPTVKEYVVPVEMSPIQAQVYHALERQLPGSIRNTIEQNLVPQKRDIAKLNAFLSAARQVSNTNEKFYTDSGTPQYSPKLKSLVQNVLQTKGPALIYSNYLDAGVNPISELLTQAKASHAIFTGGLSDVDRKKIIQNYNKGKLKALIVSSAGAQGLDLKGTKSVHITEPAWHDAKLQQTIGRSARKNSHAALPPEERNVEVFKYQSLLPQERSGLLWLNKTRPTSADQYLDTLSKKKKALNDEFLRSLDTPL